MQTPEIITLTFNLATLMFISNLAAGPKQSVHNIHVSNSSFAPFVCLSVICLSIPVSVCVSLSISLCLYLSICMHACGYMSVYLCLSICTMSISSLHNLPVNCVHYFGIKCYFSSHFPDDLHSFIVP